MSFLEKVKSLHNQATESMLGSRRLVFHHVPKCAGTSVSRALRLRYALSQAALHAPSSRTAVMQQKPDLSEEEYYQRQLTFREQFLFYHLAMDTKCIIGHIIFSESAHQQYADKYLFATCLREPMQRLLSNYRFSTKSYDPKLNEEDLSAYLESFEGQNQVTTYTRYFFGGPLPSNTSRQFALEQAKGNLSKFDVVGTTENLAQFARDLGSKLRLPLAFGRHNQGADSNANILESLSEPLQQRIRSLCEQDIEIYQFATERVSSGQTQSATDKVLRGPA